MKIKVALLLVFLLLTAFAKAELEVKSFFLLGGGDALELDKKIEGIEPSKFLLFFGDSRTAATPDEQTLAFRFDVANKYMFETVVLVKDARLSLVCNGRKQNADAYFQTRTRASKENLRAGETLSLTVAVTKRGNAGVPPGSARECVLEGKFEIKAASDLAGANKVITLPEMKYVETTTSEIKPPHLQILLPDSGRSVEAPSLCIREKPCGTSQLITITGKDRRIVFNFDFNRDSHAGLDAFNIITLYGPDIRGSSTLLQPLYHKTLRNNKRGGKLVLNLIGERTPAIVYDEKGREISRDNVELNYGFHIIELTRMVGQESAKSSEELLFDGRGCPAGHRKDKGFRKCVPNSYRLGISDVGNARGTAFAHYLSSCGGHGELTPHILDAKRPPRFFRNSDGSYDFQLWFSKDAEWYLPIRVNWMAHTTERPLALGRTYQLSEFEETSRTDLAGLYMGERDDLRRGALKVHWNGVLLNGRRLIAGAYVYSLSVMSSVTGNNEDGDLYFYPKIVPPLDEIRAQGKTIYEGPCEEVTDASCSLVYKGCHSN